MNKRTLTDTELYAHSKNRHEQKHLSNKLEHLEQCEHYSRDNIRVEIQNLRKFLRDNLRTSGWSPVSLPPQFADVRISSSKSEPFGRRRSDDDYRTSDQMYKPWAYTYSVESHNKVYKDLSQAAENSKKALATRGPIGSPSPCVSPRRAISSSPCSTSNGRQTRLSLQVPAAAGVERAKTAWKRNDKLLIARPSTSPYKSLSANGNSEIDLAQSVNVSFNENLDKQISSVAAITRAKSAWTSQSSRSKNGESQRPKTVEGTQKPVARLARTTSAVKGCKKSKDLFVCSICGRKKLVLNHKLPESVEPMKEHPRAKSALSSLENISHSHSEGRNVNEPEVEQKKKMCSCRHGNPRKLVSDSRVSGIKRQQVIRPLHNEDFKKKTQIVDQSCPKESSMTTANRLLPDGSGNIDEHLDANCSEQNESCHNTLHCTGSRSEKKKMLSNKIDKNSADATGSPSGVVNYCVQQNRTDKKDGELVFDEANEKMDIKESVVCAEINHDDLNPSTWTDLADSFTLNQHHQSNNLKSDACFDNKSTKNSISSSADVNDSPNYDGNDPALKAAKQQTFCSTEQERADSSIESKELMLQGSDFDLDRKSDHCNRPGQHTLLIDTDATVGITEARSDPDHIHVVWLQSEAKEQSDAMISDGDLAPNTLLDDADFEGNNNCPLIVKGNSLTATETKLIHQSDYLNGNAGILSDKEMDVSFNKNNECAFMEGSDSLHNSPSGNSNSSCRHGSVNVTTDCLITESRQNNPKPSARSAKKKQTLDNDGDDVFTRISKELLRKSKISKSELVDMGYDDMRRELRKLGQKFGNNKSHGNRQIVVTHTGQDMSPVSIISSKLGKKSCDNGKPFRVDLTNTASNSNVSFGYEKSTGQENKDSEHDIRMKDENGNPYKPNSSNNKRSDTHKQTNKTSKESSEKTLDNNGNKTNQNPSDETNNPTNSENRNQDANASQVTSDSCNTKRRFLRRHAYHKGVRIANYVSPQLRYKTAARDKAKKSVSVRWHSDGEVVVTAHQVEMDPLSLNISFPRQARQRALTKLVEANHARPLVDSQKYLDAALRSRIQQFLQSMEPYCQN